MRTILPQRLVDGRIREGSYASDDTWGTTGAFQVMGPCGASVRIIASNADYPEISQGWEHVSVSLPNRCPNWPEMCFVKDLFWTDEEAVVQFHPPKSDYVNNHAYCLHMWRDTLNEPRRPPSILVGHKSIGTLNTNR